LPLELYNEFQFFAETLGLTYKMQKLTHRVQYSVIVTQLKIAQ
jgi:hypothetical protein